MQRVKLKSRSVTILRTIGNILTLLVATVAALLPADAVCGGGCGRWVRTPFGPSEPAAEYHRQPPWSKDALSIG
jgi:hypothetical protein